MAGERGAFWRLSYWPPVNVFLTSASLVAVTAVFAAFAVYGRRAHGYSLLIALFCVAIAIHVLRLVGHFISRARKAVRFAMLTCAVVWLAGGAYAVASLRGAVIGSGRFLLRRGAEPQRKEFWVTELTAENQRAACLDGWSSSASDCAS